MANVVVLSLFLFFFFNLSSAARVSFNVQKLGAKADGKTDSTKYFLNAWTLACASAKPAEVYVPRGRYLLYNPLVFNGRNCKASMYMRIYGTLVAPSDYKVIGNAGNWIKFERVNGLTVSGGTLDGRGAGLWACKASGKSCPIGATTLGIYSSNNVVISRLTSFNSQMFHIIIYRCSNTKLQGIKIIAPDSSPNTDGINIQLSSGVSILSSQIGTGDDCVSIGPGSTNTWIERVSCGPGHGISIGSLGWGLKEPGVQNLTLKSVTFRNTENGVRMKTWARASNGFVKDVLYQNIVMSNVRNPILIDQEYCPDKKNCPNQVSGVKISNVRYQNIRGTSATPVAVRFKCSKKFPCSGIRLQDVSFTYNNRAAIATCSNARGTAKGVMKPSSCL